MQQIWKKFSMKGEVNTNLSGNVIMAHMGSVWEWG